MKNAFCKSVALMFVFAFIVQSSLFAIEKPEDFNPLEMTAEERMEWIINNVEVSYEGTAEQVARNVYLSTKTTTTVATQETVTGEQWADIGKMTTRVDYVCNDSKTKILDYSTGVFNSVILVEGTVKETDLTTNPSASDGVRLMYETWFTRLEGTYYISHLYILKDNGTYELRVHNFTM